MSKYYKEEDIIKAIESADTFTMWQEQFAINTLKSLPTIDIVHCRECKRWIGESEWYEESEYKRCQNGGMFTAPNHYCAWGERIEE